MTQEALAPTPERLRRSEWDRPETDAKTQRRAYKARYVFLELLRNQKIDGNMLLAAEKFNRHLEGAEGHDVRVQDYSSGPSSDVAEFSRTIHATSLADAKKALRWREFRAMELLCQEGSTLESVGSELGGYKSRQSAVPYAVAIVQEGLQKLVDLWLTERKRPPSRT